MLRKTTIQASLVICCLQLSLALILPTNRIGISHRRLGRLAATPNHDDDECNDDDIGDTSRRLALQSMILATTTTLPLSASAGKPEIDMSGNMFSPQAEMLRGGSDATRGIRVEQSTRPMKLSPGQSVQSVYETRFIAYLSRFLLNCDPAARSWWVKQGLDEGWSIDFDESKANERDLKFAEFAESVEVGLSDYFVGPYGSYGSLEAAKAGIVAAQQVPSTRATERSFWEQLIPGANKKTQPILAAIDEDLSKQGVLNLYTLLKARYTSKAEQRQLAILFSLISKPDLQPTEEIRSLLGEADNASVTKIGLSLPQKARNEAESRTSSRRGGGYSISESPKITVDVPPALGASYKEARIEPIMKPTTRVLRINILDGGEGYTEAPTVKVTQSGSTTKCEACAIMDRNGHVESIVVLDPGYGYGQGKKVVPPKISIEERRPTKGGAISSGFRPAKAEAELEWQIVGMELLDGGNGYAANDFPKVLIDPPSDPDWYVQENTYRKPNPVEPIKLTVTEMRLGDGTLIDKPVMGNEVSPGILSRMERDPLGLLPTRTRPELQDTFQGPLYTIPSLPMPSLQVAELSARYRALDPIFGPIGRAPVTKGARSLSTSEYSRLALSGAVCTVIVRTLLNPLELVKTKIQLNNDQEVNDFALSKMKASAQQEKDTDKLPGNAFAKQEQKKDIADTKTKTAKEESAGTVEMIQSLAELRGVWSLFQAADITFLASLVFGSFGFGATELFRRSFTAAFFAEEGGQVGSEVILLVAAAGATVVTSAAAAPFEVLRVKSMGLVEAKGWTEVLDLFLEDKNGAPRGDAKLKPKDLLPLWSGFSPTVSRELPFAVTKFLVFDILAKDITGLVNAQMSEGAIPVQVGIGTAGLAISAVSGAVAGVAGAIISHPADLILTLTSTNKSNEQVDWKDVVKDLLSRDGGIANLFIGLPARSVFFFLVIGLQFFLYDYVKNIFEVGSEDLNLVLDVFYAVRQGLVDVATTVVD